MAEAVSENSIDLGFLEECESYLLTNTYFPSKVGGKPAWLELENIPTLEQTKCRKCNEVLVFLCQIYASQEDVNCFHRTIYVFVCKNATCWQPHCSKNIVAYRSQLPRTNKYYSYEPPSEEQHLEETKSPIRLCEVCGIRGPYNCSKCKEVSYCGTGHQKIDWLNGHKNKCKNSITQPPDENYSFLLPEFELVIDAEDTKDKNNETEEQAELRRKAEADTLVADNGAIPGASGMDDIPEEELLPYAMSEQDPIFKNFKKRIASYKNQVIRYDRGGQPLWLCGKYQLKPEKIPNCELCHSKRVFEFQIMPQILNSLKEPNLEWGIITVYTCENNCDVGSSYAKEFVHKQDVI